MADDIEELRSDIEDARTELAGTVADIVERVNPTQVLARKRTALADGVKHASATAREAVASGVRRLQERTPEAADASGRRPMDWVVLRNRMATLDARNKRRVASALEELARRIGFRLVPGFSERVVFRELFLSGLTLLDLRETDPQAISMSNVAARQEVRDLVRALDLPAASAAA